jgi:hypothetical protein
MQVIYSLSTGYFFFNRQVERGVRGVARLCKLDAEPQAQHSITRIFFNFRILRIAWGAKEANPQEVQL